MTPSKTLAKALARFIGPAAVLAYQDGVKLPGQFYTVLVPANTPVGRAERREANDPDSPDILETIAGFREVMYSVTVLRDEPADDGFTALDRAEELRMKMHSSAAREHMLGYGLALASVSAVRDLTQVEDAAQEPRAQFDLVYHAVQTLSSVVRAIESIDIIGHYEGAFHYHESTINLEKP